MSKCKMFYLDSNSCCYCETVFELYSIRTREHMIPITRGGKSGYPNKASCCPHCNLAKSNMLPSEFLAELELAYSLNKSIKRIKVEVMPIMIKNLKLIASRVENKPDYLNPTAKKLLQCGN